MVSFGSSIAREEKKESSATVKFNVGGKLYEVSKSLLQGFPDTMLFEKALLASAFSPIFIDRDPDRFSFCLDYMRDNGNVYLPESVSKKAFLEDLKFLGFLNIDQTKICDEKSQLNCIGRFYQVVEANEKRIDHLEKDLIQEEQEILCALERRKKEIKMEKLALRCFKESVKETRIDVTYGDIRGLYHAHKDQYFIDCCEKLSLGVNDQAGNSVTVSIIRKINTTDQQG